MTDITDEVRADLKAKAGRSLVNSPAPWATAETHHGELRTVDALGDRVSDALLSEDAEFHAAANPAVILSLLAALEEAQASAREQFATAKHNADACTELKASNDRMRQAVEGYRQVADQDRARAEKAEQQVVAYRQGVAKAFNALCPTCRGNAELPDKASDPYWLALSTVTEEAK